MNQLSSIIKQHRSAMRLTLRQLAAASGVSASHLGRIERGQRSPSANTLRKIAEHLGFDETELFTVAGFLSPSHGEDTEGQSGETISRLDPYVARVLAQEPARVQYLVTGILTILKSLSKNIKEE